jgi:hypothetical protein
VTATLGRERDSSLDQLDRRGAGGGQHRRERAPGTAGASRPQISASKDRREVASVACASDSPHCAARAGSARDVLGE